MSASNWAKCPRCTRRYDERVARLRKAAAAALVKATAEEWKAMDDGVQSAVKDTPGLTLREDYEFTGAEEGTVVATYGASCSRCALTLSFEHEVAFEGVDE